MKSLVAKWGSKETSRCECECKRKVDFRQPILDNILNMTQHWGENSKAPLFPSSSNPPPSPALPARPHLPFTLCALTSLPMRVIGIFKRWRGQKGTQPHPENLIGESLEAQHSKGESLLNYIYIHTYSFFHSRSVSILSLFQRLFIITWESDRNIFHSDIISLFFYYLPDPLPNDIFFDIFTFFSIFFWSSRLSASRLFLHIQISYTFTFHFLWTFRCTVNSRALGFHLWKHLCGSLFRLQHWTFNRHFH